MVEEQTSRTNLGPWHVVALALVLAALVGIVAIVAGRWTDAQDAAAVLGVIVPVFASIGAAVFGIQVAYERGKSAGTTEGKDEGQKEGRRQTAAVVLAKLGPGGPVGAPRAAATGSGAPTDPVGDVRSYLSGLLAE